MKARPLVALTFGMMLLPFSPGRAQPVSEEAASGESTNRAGEYRRRGNSSTNDPIARIRDEGLNHSQVMDTLRHLTEIIGPRLTGSPNLKRANDWTREQLSQWGLTNAHLEAWGPFGRGWSLKRFSAQIVEPQTIPLIGCPNAWSPGLDKPLLADVIYFNVRTNSDLEKFRGKLKGAIVLASPIRELKPAFDPLAFRLMETNLLRLANAGERSSAGNPGVTSPDPSSESFRRVSASRAEDAIGSDNSSGGADGTRGPRRRRPQGRYLPFLAKEGAALIVNSSSLGDGGTFFVAAASVPGSETNDFGRFSFTNAPRPWWTNAPAIPPQITIAAEDYNRAARMLEEGEKLKMLVDLDVQFHNEDPMAYNTIAEIPGSDLKNELVMLGAHLDSWHSGTGATDNGAGVAATMEAVRILTALKLQPRRTIRIGLWTGEEQGLMGSKAYVTRHFGYYTNSADDGVVRAPKDETGTRTRAQSGTNSAALRKLVRHKEYEKLSAYFNLDNGAGKIRGIYMQGNEAVRPMFRRWLAPFADLGADTLTLSNTSGTDHLSFDAVRLPGFEFIQDPLEYRSRTHHSNQDVYDRIIPDDLKQAATIIAAVVYNAATVDEKLPRKSPD
jgi:hypothetical protein